MMSWVEDHYAVAHDETPKAQPVVMDHASKAGDPKLLHECSLPLTGQQVVDMVITNLCVFEVDRGNGMKLTEMAPGVTVDDVKVQTEADFATEL